MNLEQIGHVWYATVLVPVDAREALGRKRFRKTMKTSNRREAALRAAPLIAHWKAQISQARGSTNAVSSEAQRWKTALAQAPDSLSGLDPWSGEPITTRETWELALSDVIEQKEEAHGFDHAKDFNDLVTGAATATGQYFDTWKTKITLAAKTKDQMVRDVGLLIAKFPTLQGISKNSVRRWMDEISDEGKGIASQRRILSFCRHYWKLLQRYDEVSKDFTPFDGVLEPADKKKRKKNTNFAYAPADVVKLWEAARSKRVGVGAKAPLDTQLADLIKLGAYTGTRIEELCSMKLDKVTDDTLTVADAKTEAGWRTIPIHSQILDLVKRLREDSKDGYLVSGLTFNKFEDRSNAIGKRFGRLKTSLGFPSTHTFHSFRSTVATLLENAGVPEGIAADIVGHDKPGMTYGLYSGGAGIETMREALEKVSYPFP